MTTADQLAFGFVRPLTPRQQGHRAAERAARRTTRLDATWLEVAMQSVLIYAVQTPGPWLLEDARAFAEQCGVKPALDPRAWGHVIQSLKRRGRIVFVDHGAAKSSHGSPKCRWRIA